jgi:hypothetical protein
MLQTYAAIGIAVYPSIDGENEFSQNCGMADSRADFSSRLFQ